MVYKSIFAGLVFPAAAVLIVWGFFTGSLDFYGMSSLLFIDILAALFYRDRKNMKREFVVFLRRTKFGKKFLIKTGERFPRFWKALGTVGVAVGFVASLAVVAMLVFQLFLLVSGAIKIGAGFLVPTISQEASVGPGYFAVPFWYWIISIALLVVVHEGLHGIIAASEKGRIKSLGWGALLVIPLAFVDLDEKQLEKKKPMQQLRVFAAGSFANFMLAGVSVLVLSYGFSGIYMPVGVGYNALIKDYPAEQVNLTGVIVGINNYTVLDSGDLRVALDSIGANKTITVYTVVYEKGEIRENKTFSLRTAERPDNESGGFIGISQIFDARDLKAGLKPYAGAINFTIGLLGFLFLINFFVGLVNLLPVKPLDGGRMWEILFQKAVPSHAKTAANIFGYFALVVLILNFAIPFVFV